MYNIVKALVDHGLVLNVFIKVLFRKGGLNLFSINNFMNTQSDKDPQGV